MAARRLRVSDGDQTVGALIDGPRDPRVAVVLAHGAGAPMDSPFMAFMAGHIAADPVAVVRFNFRYMDQQRKAPDRQAILKNTFRAVVANTRDALTPRKLVIGGKSLGGRIASLVAADGDASDGLVFLGYPLHPPGRPDRIRDEHLYAIDAPMLFVEGTRDPFCPIDTLETVRARLKARNDLALIADGDHSLKVRKSSGRSTEEAWAEAAAVVARWVASL